MQALAGGRKTTGKLPGLDFSKNMVLKFEYLDTHFMRESEYFLST